MSLQIITGDCRLELKKLPEKSVQCCVTSPPYWGLRDYGHSDQIGLEQSPQAYVETMRCQVFSEVWRVLKDDGTLWLNLGDSYAAAGGDRVNGSQGKSSIVGHTSPEANPDRRNKPKQIGLKPKDLVGIPWRVAFALQADGWYLRSDIIWHKPNPMPESVTDRPTKSHEYIFLLTKREKYYYDAGAIKEPASESTHARISQNLQAQVGSFRANGGNKTNGPMKAVIAGSTRKLSEAGSGIASNRSYEAALAMPVTSRNKRSVWTVGTDPYSEAHFATFPPDLIKPCILAGTKPGDVVLDPFGGSGTTGMVALELGRSAILIELNPDYTKLCDERCNVTAGLPLQ